MFLEGFMWKMNKCLHNFEGMLSLRMKLGQYSNKRLFVDTGCLKDDDLMNYFTYRRILKLFGTSSQLPRIYISLSKLVCYQKSKLGPHQEMSNKKS